MNNDGSNGRITTMKRISLANDPEAFVTKAIELFTRKSAANRHRTDGGHYWDHPLVGFASGADPLFRQYKKVIGRFHLTPREIFNLTFRKGTRAAELSVISWVLPAAEDIRKSNRKETRYPSLLWSHARHFGEAFNVKLRDHVVSLLMKKGYRAVAPMNSPHWRRLRSPRVGLASSWSERHVAYACGLGAFGLSDGLITPKGKAMRLGSVVTDLPLRPSRRVSSDIHANCLHYFNATCMMCAARCPAGAITAKGHDKDKCREYSYQVVKKTKAQEYGVDITGCGLCQTRVPCEFEIPRLIRKEYKKQRPL
jgi:epoxyqueuosine reductase